MKIKDLHVRAVADGCDLRDRHGHARVSSSMNRKVS